MQGDFFEVIPGTIEPWGIARENYPKNAKMGIEAIIRDQSNPLRSLPLRPRI